MTKFFTATDLPQNTDQGPLASIIPAYAALLSQQGYTQQYARLQISDLTESTLHRYLRSRHQRFRRRRGEASIVSRLVNLLHALGLLPNEVAPPLDDPHQRALNDFYRYLSEERGLDMATRINYRAFIQRFLSAQFGAKPIRSADLNAEDVIRFIRNQAPGLSHKRAGLMVSALRSFFHYLLH